MSINYWVLKTVSFIKPSDNQSVADAKALTAHGCQSHESANAKQTSTKLLKQMMAISLVSGMLATTACQKTEDSEVIDEDAETSVQTPVSSDNQDADGRDGQDSPDDSQNSVYSLTDNGAIEDSGVSAVSNDADNTDADTTDADTLTTLQEKRPIDPSRIDNLSRDSASGMASSSNAANTNNQAAPKGETQITEVEYKDANGRHIHVTYQTSATSVLQANITMPSGKTILLTAPPAQGNNPTYQSPEGDIQLVTHAGGNKVDFIFQGKSINFTAVETDAALVVAQ